MLAIYLPSPDAAQRWFMKSARVVCLAFSVALVVSACGGKPKNRVPLEEAKPGRDLELFRDGVTAIRKGSYDQGRMLINTSINTYPDSPMIRVAKLTIADSFYLEGGGKNLAQADVEYNDWLQFFPDDQLAVDVMMKRAEIHMRQVIAFNRDTTHARQAERQLKEILKLHPTTAKKPEIESRINEIQEFLAMHELDVARFYYERRQSAQAAQLRTEEILNKYPAFSRFDEALFLHAKAVSDQEDTETAAQDLTRLVINYPRSEFREKAEALLKKWGKQIPQPDPAKASEAPPEGKGLFPRMLGLVFGPKVSNISSKGVIVDRDKQVDEIVARAQEVSGAAKPVGAITPGAGTTTNAVDSRPRRTGEAGQDVVVKPGSSSSSPPDQKSSSKDKDKKKNGNSKGLRNPGQ